MHARNTSEKIVEIQGLGSGGGGEKKTKTLLCTRRLASSRVCGRFCCSAAGQESPQFEPHHQKVLRASKHVVVERVAARRAAVVELLVHPQGKRPAVTTGPDPRYEGARTSGTEPCRAAQGRCEFNYAPAADREAVVMAELEVAVLPGPVVHLPRRVQPEQEHLAGAVVERLLPPRVCRKAPKDLPPPSPQPPRPKP